jgi:colicin import membrane protein
LNFWVSAREPGIAVSGAAHAALLLAMLLAFADAGRFGDAQEPVPIEVISDSQFNRIMGEKVAEKGAKPRVDTLADTSEVKPSPPLEEAKRDVPTPPSRPPEPATPPLEEAKSLAAVPPPLPVEPPPPVPEPPKRDPAAELAKPEPEPIAKPPAPPKIVRPPEPKVDPLEQAKKLLEQKKQEEAKVDAKRAKPTTDDPQYKFDSHALSKILTHDTPQQAGSTGKELNKTASLGAPTASAARMPGNLLGQLHEYLKEAYHRCFNPAPFDVGDYKPKISVRYNIDGSLASEPKLANPPSDPALRAFADSAMRAVRSCNPLHIPAIYQPYYEQWRDTTMQFTNE